MAGVPVIFGLRNALLLEPPSSFQRQFVKSSEEKRLRMTELEHELLSKGKKKRLTSTETEDSSDENEALEDQNLGLQAPAKANKMKRGMIVKDRVRFKRNKAKVIIHDLDCLLQAFIIILLCSYCFCMPVYCFS